MTTLPKTLLLLGSGELGKEVTIAAQRLGCRVIACDRYCGAPAMQVADHSEVLDMNDAETLKAVIRHHKPDVVIPEIEALAVNAL
ncbi:MAG: phosphoribosylglycinamide formyltransferase 2, partial [Prochlorococcus sp.]